MADIKFVDGVGPIRLSGGVIRVDMVVQSPTARTNEGQAVPELVDQLVMSPDGFLRMFARFGQTIQQMQKDGLLATKPADDPTAEMSENSDAPKSPNF